MPNDVIVRPRPRAYPAMRWLGGSRRAGSVSERALLVSFVGGLVALGAALVADRHDGGLVENDPLSAHEYQRVGGARSSSPVWSCAPVPW